MIFLYLVYDATPKKLAQKKGLQRSHSRRVYTIISTETGDYDITGSRLVEGSYALKQKNAFLPYNVLPIALTDQDSRN